MLLIRWLISFYLNLYYSQRIWRKRDVRSSYRSKHGIFSTQELMKHRNSRSLLLTWPLTNLTIVRKLSGRPSSLNIKIYARRKEIISLAKNIKHLNGIFRCLCFFKTINLERKRTHQRFQVLTQRYASLTFKKQFHVVAANLFITLESSW